MVNVVLTHRSNSVYDDRPDRYYHFPAQYLKAMQEAVGDWALYYEPRRGDGRQSYFALVAVDSVVADTQRDGHFYANLSRYLDFDRAVPMRVDSRTFEAALTKADGSANAGAFGWSVRRIPPAEFDAILNFGFAPVLHPTTDWQIADQIPSFQVAEASLEWEPRAVVERLTLRPFRDAAFSHRVREAYDNCCAISGLKLINGGGRPEVQAAHIRPVAAGGPDAARNGLALSGTVHWMFDRGLISVDDKLRVIVANGNVADMARRLLASGVPLRPPNDMSARPHPEFLAYHRTHIFKG